MSVFLPTAQRLRISLVLHHVVVLILLLLSTTSFALILPGTGLASTRQDLQVVIFEHTSLGTGGLVLNQPTPICLKDLKIPRFQQAFGNHTLMFGCGLSAGSSNFNLAMGDMAPWFWIHTCPDLPKSFQLEGAEGGNLYMGGSIDEATKRIVQGTVDPYCFKFFYKYMKWESGQLEREIEQGRWTAKPQNPLDAVRPYSLPIFD